MLLSDFSIKRPMAMVAIILALMCLGLLALNKLRVNESPDVQEPQLVVNIPYPGASPETVEREIVNRIEKSLQGISGVDQVYSTAREGSASITIVFAFKKNLIEAGDEVRNAIAAVRYKLPSDMREPVIQRADMSAGPIMKLALSSSSQSLDYISRLAEDTLADRLRAIDGVATVNINGALKRELSVLLRAEKLREYNVSVDEVVTALRNQNATAPVGKINGILDEKSIRLVGRIATPAGFEQVVVKRLANEVVRLGQVATVADGFAELGNISLRNGNPNVSLAVSRNHDAGTVEVADKLRKEVTDINRTLPQGTRLAITEDRGREAESSLHNVTHALVFGAGLTIFVVYVFLNSWRSTLITALSLPTSVIAAFIAVWLCGFTLNFMTLLGLSLAIGVLIDDAIVVRENIVHHMEGGVDRLSAARMGTADIGVAVVATTFAIIAVFLPVGFMPGIPGEWFRPFALTVASSVLVSLFISFTLDPMLSAYWGDPPGRRAAPRKGVSLWLATFNAWFDRQADGYGNVVAWALRHRFWMSLIAAASFAAAIALHGAFGGSSFLPEADSGYLAIDVRTPASSNLAYSRAKMEKAAELARTVPEIEWANVNVTPGGGRIFISIGKSSERKRSAHDVAADLRKLMGQLIGAEYVVLENLSNGAQKPVQIRFSGPDSRKLMEITNDFMARLKGVAGAVDVGLSEQDPKDELKIELDRGLANALGISANDTAQALRVAFAGIEVGDWIDPAGEARDVAVRLHPDDRASLENIERLPVPVPGSNMLVPLDQIAAVTMDKGPSQIQHYNGKRMITVSANAQGRSPGEVTADALRIAKAINFPSGYGIELGGSSRDQQNVFTQMGIALLMGVGMMYLVLVVQFGSFTAPLPVMLSLPLSLIGVVVALLLAHCTLNLMSLIGVITLMGLVAKNAILLLDAARKQQAEGADRAQALVHAGRKRLRPILMTTFALIAGMMPVAIGVGEGGEFYRPMAVAIIGGTITSTLLTLLVVPTFYDGIEHARDRMVAKCKSLARRRDLSPAGFAANEFYRNTPSEN